MLGLAGRGSCKLDQVNQDSCGSSIGSSSSVGTMAAAPTQYVKMCIWANLSRFHVALYFS